MTTRTEIDRIIQAALDAGGIAYVRNAEGAYLATLPGTHKLATM
ncbi:MAG: YbjN domain-containing protein, partial [Pseudonocardiales bacterium]